METNNHLEADPNRALHHTLDVSGRRYRKTDSIEAVRIEHDFTVETLEGPLSAPAGSWVARGVKGELWPIADDVFQATYFSLERATMVATAPRAHNEAVAHDPSLDTTPTHQPENLYPGPWTLWLPPKTHPPHIVMQRQVDDSHYQQVLLTAELVDQLVGSRVSEENGYAAIDTDASALEAIKRLFTR